MIVAAVAEEHPDSLKDRAVIDWAVRVSIEQIPGLLVFLAGRLLAETNRGASTESAERTACEKLLTAGALAKHLNVPESWVRTEERTGQIPGVRIGKYVRFRLSEVERTLADKGRHKP
jgi:hypothetical protein